MSGITFLYQPGKLDPDFSVRVKELIEKIPEAEILIHKNKFILLKKSGNNYPIQLIDHKDYVLVVEGEIYGTEMVSDINFLKNISSLLADSQDDKVLSYLRNLDGEFIIYLIDKSTQNVTIVNDYLGRLPAYYWPSKTFILSRDISLMKELKGALEFCEQGLYEFVRLGYPLGNKTLFKDLYRLKPSSCIELNGGMSITNQTISLQQLQESGRGIKDPIEQLYKLFQQAVKNRLDSNDKLMLSLSGGLDSRIIMGEIEKEKKSVGYESFLYKNAIIESDVEVVSQLCALYNTHFGLMELKEWAPVYFGELADTKYGMNYLGMAFIIPFLKRMSQKYDMMLTGDGGDKTLAYLFPPMNLFVKDTAKLILRTNVITSEAICNQLFGFDTKEKEEKMRSHLNGYGYKDPSLNYKYFLIFERTKNWLFEGEDRNRQYIWSTSPFYNPEFFNLVHSINEKDKINYKLYKAFTNIVDQKLNNIPNANWGFPINETKKLHKLLFKQTVKQHIKDFVPKSNSNQVVTPDMRDASFDMSNESLQESLYMNKHFDIKKMSQESLFHLLTLLKVAELKSLKLR